MLDKNFIIRKVKLIHEELSHLEELSNFSVEEIAADYKKTAIVERLLEKIITRAIDINQHIIAEMGKGIVSTFWIIYQREAINSRRKCDLRIPGVSLLNEGGLP